MSNGKQHNILLARSKAAYERGDYFGAARALDALVHKVDREGQLYSQVHTLRAVVEMKLGDLPKAKKMLQLVRERERGLQYWQYSAEIFRASKDYDLAERAILRALQLGSDDPDTHIIAGAVWHTRRNFADAEKAHRRALDMAPQNAEVWSNLGNTLGALGRADEARDAFKRAVIAKPTFAMGYANWGSVELREGNYDAAIDCYRSALQHEPLNASAHFGLGLIALSHGNYKDGWRLYEWRWRAQEEEKKFPWPRWHGVREAERTGQGNRLLLIAEQGFGDTLMMLRFLRTLDDMGLEVSILCHASLHVLIKHNFPWVKLAGAEVNTADHDFFLHMMALPYALDLVGPFVCDERYLLADKGIGRAYGAKCNVGYCWRGNPEHDNDRNRSIDRYAFMEIFADRNVEEFSFVHGDGVQFQSWMDTCRHLVTIDLVVTVDTALAHLAAAMGKPVWLLLPFAPDWRWLIEGDRSAWYPTMRLFRQKKPGDWKSLVRLVRDELAGFTTRFGVAP